MVKNILFFLGITWLSMSSGAHANDVSATEGADRVRQQQRETGGASDTLDTEHDTMHRNNVFFKIDQGFSYGRLLDQRMSNLHYTGLGGVLSFGRYVEAENYVSELSFARIAFHMAQPGHSGTRVTNPSGGIRYKYLRKFESRGAINYRLGGQAEAFANVRLVPALSNSYLYVDFITEISPRLDVEYRMAFLNREWNFDFSLAVSFLGYAVRIPEYGASYQLGSDGSETLANNISMMLHPGNYNHFITGIFLREFFGRQGNPNRYRIGYVWDFHTIRGDHSLITFSAGHQIVVELFFLVN